MSTHASFGVPQVFFSSARHLSPQQWRLVSTIYFRMTSCEELPYWFSFPVYPILLSVLEFGCNTKVATPFISIGDNIPWSFVSHGANFASAKKFDVPSLIATNMTALFHYGWWAYVFISMFITLLHHIVYLSLKTTCIANIVNQISLGILGRLALHWKVFLAS